MTYNILHETEDNLWSVLLMTGYLTKSDPDEDGNTVSLKIPNKEIAGIMYISEHTVNDYTKKIYRKLEVHSRHAAAQIINRHNLFTV